MPVALEIWGMHGVFVRLSCNFIKAGSLASSTPLLLRSSLLPSLPFIFV